MEANKLTTRSQEALSAAVRLAADRGHPAVEPAHLLAALLGQADGTARRCCGRSAPTRPTSRAENDALLAPLPAASGATVSAPQFSRDRAPGAERRRRSRPSSWATSTCPPSTCWSAWPPTDGAVAELLQPARGHPRRAARGVQGRARLGPGHLARPRGDVPGAGEVRRRPHRAGPRRQARPGHRPGHRDPPGRAGAVPADQEQPGADRRARRRQDRRGRGAGPAHRRRRRAGVAARTSGWSRSTSARWWPARSTAASSRSGSRPCSTRSRTPTGRSSRSSTSCTPSSAPARPRARWTPATCSSRCSPAASCGWSARPRWTSTASTSRRTRRWSAASSRCWSASRRSRTPSPSCAASRAGTRRTTRCRSPTPRWSPRRPCPTATSPPGSCRTRRSTWSTRPRPGCGWRSTRGRWRSTSCSARSTG